MMITKNPNLSSGFLTLIICLALYYILIHVFLKESLKIDPIYEYIDVALGPDPEGSPGRNDGVSSFTNEARQTGNNENVSSSSNPLPISTSENDDNENLVPINVKPKKINKNVISKVEKKNIPEAPPSPKAVLQKQDLNKVNNNSSNQTELNQGNGTKEGIAGNPDGNPNSTNYTGQPYSVVNGDRRITYSEQFAGDVDAATIYAKISVNQDGQGNFIDFERGSSSRNVAYKNAIISILEKMKFNSSDHRSVVTVKFNFIVQ